MSKYQEFCCDCINDDPPEKILQLVEIINKFFGCDASYFDVNPFDLAMHLLDNGVDIVENNIM